MRGCLSLASFVVLVNGATKGWMKAFRGLRQGDPLSPFLYTIVANVLSRMLLRARERGLFEGFLVGRNRVRVSHLQFTNDTIFFYRASVEDLKNLKLILMVFRVLLGLKINLNKSTLFGINTNHDQISSLALMLGCTNSNQPLKYLGLPLVGNPRSIWFWDSMIDKVSKRLDGWKKAFVSLRGRITPILSCLSHMPSYFLSLFKIPASLASKIEKMHKEP